MSVEKSEFVAACNDPCRRRVAVSVSMILAGLSTAGVSLVLISNKFGNTDTLGLLQLALAGWLPATGVFHLFLRFQIAALVGTVGAPLALVLAYLLFWMLLGAAAEKNRHHPAFASRSVDLIPPAAQMNELFDDCRHSISYGAYGGEDVPMFNSTAYFGGRYELAMQVPVIIESETSGSTIGGPRFHLNEVEAIAISPSGQVGASFSRSVKLSEAEWERVYQADGDFSTIGFDVNPAPVENFQKYSDGARASD